MTGEIVSIHTSDAPAATAVKSLINRGRLRVSVLTADFIRKGDSITFS